MARVAEILASAAETTQALSQAADAEAFKRCWSESAAEIGWVPAREHRAWISTPPVPAAPPPPEPKTTYSKASENAAQERAWRQSEFDRLPKHWQDLVVSVSKAAGELDGPADDPDDATDFPTLVLHGGFKWSADAEAAFYDLMSRMPGKPFDLFEAHDGPDLVWLQASKDPGGEDEWKRVVTVDNPFDWSELLRAGESL